MAEKEPFGLLLVDKPGGLSSHDVVLQVRRHAGVRKVGHTGTLDPMATGLLVLCLGAATRLSEYLSRKQKRYQARIRFGTATDTHDGEGEVIKEHQPVPSLDQVRPALAGFIGEQAQVPPAHSAVRVQGRRAYKLARSGQAVELAPRPITIYQLDLVAYHPPDLDLDILCTSGTYIRSLARDLGAELGTAAYLSALRRSQVGPFNVEAAISLDEVVAMMSEGQWRNRLIPAAKALPDLPEIRLNPEQLQALRHGRKVGETEGWTGLARGLTEDGDLVAILEGQPGESSWQPRKVFIS
jgi:tRNA pseudouridine55 synthase